MKTLIIPDVHENIEAVWCALDAQSFDRAVFLGDWFDRFPSQPGDTLATVRWLASNQDDERFTFLWGNHDLPYFYLNPGLRCSGHQPYLKETLMHAHIEMPRYFQLYTTVEGFLISHAGFTPDFLSCHNSPEFNQEITIAFDLLDTDKHNIHPLLQAGWCRWSENHKLVYQGSDRPKGGCTWLDWNQEFEDVPGIPQIVGHTTQWKPQQKGASWCLDTKMKHYGIIEDGNLTIKETPAA